MNNARLFSLVEEGDSSDSDAGARPRLSRKTAVIGNLVFMDFEKKKKKRNSPVQPPGQEQIVQDDGKAHMDVGPNASASSLAGSTATGRNGTKTSDHRHRHPLRALSTEPIVPPAFKVRQKQIQFLKSGRFELELHRRTGLLPLFPQDIVHAAEVLHRETGFKVFGPRQQPTIAESVSLRDEADIAHTLLRREIMQHARGELRANLVASSSKPISCRGADGDHSATGNGGISLQPEHREAKGARGARGEARLGRLSASSTSTCVARGSPSALCLAPLRLGQHRSFLNDDLLRMEFEKAAVGRSAEPSWLRHVEGAAVHRAGLLPALYEQHTRGTEIKRT
jgi:hypothetical protein